MQPYLRPAWTKFGLWRFFIMLYLYMVFKMLECKKKKVFLWHQHFGTLYLIVPKGNELQLSGKFCLTILTQRIIKAIPTKIKNNRVYQPVVVEQLSQWHLQHPTIEACMFIKLQVNKAFFPLQHGDQVLIPSQMSSQVNTMWIQPLSVISAVSVAYSSLCRYK